MENMLSKSDLRENRELRNRVDELLTGPDREFWKNSLNRFLRREEPVFLETESLDPFRKEKRSWQKFYKSVFGIDADFSNVVIPKRPGPVKNWWLIIVAKGMMPQRLLDKCRENFSCWCWTNKNLDEIVESERTAKDGHYAVWVRARVEADEEFKNISADDLKKKNHTGITLEERIVLELYYFWKTNKHLDIQNVTLCSGSRCSDGGVPSVDWGDGRLDVSWDDSAFANDLLRSREAVS